MSQGLHLSQRMSQQMVLSPQLQQSLALLQAPVLELKAMVEQELQQNPMLEEAAIADISQEERESNSDDAAALLDPTEPPPDMHFDPATEKPNHEPVDRLDVELQRLIQLDQEWRDHFAATNTVNRSTPEDEERRQFMFDSLTAETSLQAELLEQVRTSDLDERVRQVAELLVGNIDDYGYLQSGLSELSFSTGLSLEDLEAALKVVQSFQPPGVGARDLRECLLLQLERAGRQESLEYAIIRDHMESLGKRRYPEIARQLGISAGEAQRLAGNIAHLDPRPGRVYAPDGNQYVLPEVHVVRREDGEYTVSTNNDHIPHLRISNHYKDLLTQAETSGEVREYIREKIKAGKFLIKSIHQRQSTILNIANEIV
ncbi:MAG TPA: RNA polymerase sigma-54 factor [Candidatus Limnocylindria bacterium]|nr:RNA polymerase sigma-54 factor [Candidatus Limnocylindria bacterium]